MTPTLRKRHQRTWWFLSLALVLVWGTSMMVNENNNQQAVTTNNLNKEVNIQVVSNKSTDNQSVKITLNESLVSPQTMIYLSNNEQTPIKNSLLLGRIDGKGIFEFPLDSTSSSFSTKVIKGFDGIHQKELFTAIINNK